MLMIGCPAKNDIRPFIEMYDSIIRSTSAYDKIVVLEAGKKEEVEHVYESLKKVNNKLEVIYDQTKTPLEAYNKLFELAKHYESDLLLTQTDVLFPRLYKRDWLKIMSDVAKQKDVSVVTTINGGGISGPDYINGFRWVGGWCTFIPLRTIIKIGGFDKKFPSIAYGVDIDWTYRCSKIGKIIIINYWVDHHMMNERSHDNHPDTERLKKECALYFRRKWGLGEFSNAKGDTKIRDKQRMVQERSSTEERNPTSESFP